MRLREYLARVGIEGALAPSADTLRRLHVAHLGAFIFDNLEIQRGGSIRTDLESIERKFLEGKTGGYCFEQNTLFAAALREIGFEVQTVLAHVGRPEQRSLTHLVLRVLIDGDAWLADVGFGGEGILEPLPIRDGVTVMQGGIEYSLRRNVHCWTLAIRYGNTTWDMYEFGDSTHTTADIEMANFFTSKHPSSNFRRKLTIQRATREERVILRPTMITSYRDGVRTDVEIDPSQVREKARELFDIELGDSPLLFEKLQQEEES